MEIYNTFRKLRGSCTGVGDASVGWRHMPSVHACASQSASLKYRNIREAEIYSYSSHSTFLFCSSLQRGQPRQSSICPAPHRPAHTNQGAENKSCTSLVLAHQLTALADALQCSGPRTPERCPPTAIRQSANETSSGLLPLVEIHWSL